MFKFFLYFIFFKCRENFFQKLRSYNLINIFHLAARTYLANKLAHWTIKTIHIFIFGFKFHQKILFQVFMVFVYLVIIITQTKQSIGEIIQIVLIDRYDVVCWRLRWIWDVLWFVQWILNDALINFCLILCHHIN